MAEGRPVESAGIGAGRFKAAHAAAASGGSTWGPTVEACLEALGSPPAGANLGFVYATDNLADDMGSVLTALRQGTGVEHWVGTVGLGIAGNGVEYYGCPAISVLVAALPEDGFRLFDPIVGDLEAFRRKHGAWVNQRHPIIGIVHGDPRNRDLVDIIGELADQTSAFLVGGLSSSRGDLPQIAAGSLAAGGLSGVLFASDQLAVAGLTQGCTPLAPARRITDAEGNIIKAIDGRPAVEVLRDDIGELLARDLSRIGGYIYVSFPIPGSDTGDYLVRNLIGIDPSKGWLQVSELVSADMAVAFCRRDHESARRDLQRMLEDVAGRAGGAPKAALYYSCIARGQNLFGPASEELKQIRRVLGDVPLAGFFANGEISNNRLYGYTGVLTLLL